MKFDMHCHTKEGSLDARVPISEYISLLKENGIDGMLVTDHNSYNGYRYWESHGNTFPTKDFVVLKGIEYDTSDAGHILVILPHQKHIPLIELRGMPVSMLIDIVHRHGGILGPAHPCGEKYLSLANTVKFPKQPSIVRRFDFIEVFNSCESLESNARAKELADTYKKVGFGGSDSHKVKCIGTAYTEFEEEIRNEDDLIRYIKARKPITAGGTYYHGTTKEKIGFLNHFLITSFWVYNKGGGLLRRRKRNRALTYDNEQLLASQIGFRDHFYDLDEDEEAEIMQDINSASSPKNPTDF